MDGKTARRSPFDDLSESGLLTRSDRELLFGDKEYDDPAQERKARQRMRNRIRNGLLDFVILAKYLDERDRVQIFGDVTAQLPEDVYNDDTIEAVVHAIGFLYAGARDAGVPFEDVVEQGVMKGSMDTIREPYVLHDVEVTIDERADVDLDGTFEKIAAGEEVTDRELMDLERLVFRNLDRFLAAAEDVEIDRRATYEADETLSRGESVVLVARGLENPDRLQAEIDREILDDEVMDRFGLTQFVL